MKVYQLPRFHVSFWLKYLAYTYVLAWTYVKYINKDVVLLKPKKGHEDTVNEA